jgi:probable phosphoglycerate mutase
VELLLIRHGEPVRIENEPEGADPELTERGHEQAARLAAWLAHEQLDAVYCSPMARARQTAAPLAAVFNVDAEVLDGLVEFDRESPSYIPIEELRALKDERWHAMIEGRWHELGSGEHPELFVPRVVNAVDTVITDHPGRNVALVCHGGVINVYIAALLGIERLLWFEPGYTSITRVAAARSGQRSVVSLNESAHLIATRETRA